MGCESSGREPQPVVERANARGPVDNDRVPEGHNSVQLRCTRFLQVCRFEGVNDTCGGPPMVCKHQGP